MSIEVVVSGLAAAVAAYMLVGMRQRTLALQKREQPPPLSRYPSLSMIRPIRGLDPGAEGNIVAALDNGYPGDIETLFVFDDEEEPALPLVRAAIAEHERKGQPGRARVLIAGPPQPGRTGKLNAMICGAAAAQGKFIGFADSDIRPDKEALKRLIQLLLSQPRAGDVFAPVMVSEPPRSPGDVGYAMMLNALYSAEMWWWVQKNGDPPFIMGQLMIFRREALSSIGGLDCAAGELVDDMRIGACVTAAGYRNIMSTYPVRIVDGGISSGEFVRTYRRWLAFARTGLPWTFSVSAARPYLAFLLGLFGEFIAISHGHRLAGVLPLALLLTIGVELLWLNRAAGGAPLPWRFIWVPYLLLLLGPFVWLAQLLWPEVRWRGRIYRLNSEARLAESKPLLLRKGCEMPRLGTETVCELEQKGSV
jgi:ceramide glucosyltransferase